MKNISKKSKEVENRCGVCEANFEIWLNNLRASDERKEKISEHLLSYCPVCSRTGKR